MLQNWHLIAVYLFHLFLRSVVIAQKKTASVAATVGPVPQAVSVVSSLEASQSAEADKDSSGGYILQVHL